MNEYKDLIRELEKVLKNHKNFADVTVSEFFGTFKIICTVKKDESFQIISHILGFTKQNEVDLFEDLVMEYFTECSIYKIKKITLFVRKDTEKIKKFIGLFK